MLISSDFTFYQLYDDIYFYMVTAQATRIQLILRQTPLKVYGANQYQKCSTHEAPKNIATPPQWNTASSPIQVTPQLACRTGVIFCVFQGNRDQSEASAKRELRARGGSLKNPTCPHTIVQAIPAFKYECGYLIGYFETRDPQMFSNTYHNHLQ